MAAIKSLVFTQSARYMEVEAQLHACLNEISQRALSLHPQYCATPCPLCVLSLARCCSSTGLLPAQRVQQILLCNRAAMRGITLLRYEICS